MLENANEIVNSLDMSFQDQRLTLFAALFHDVGRFPQYVRYKTFLDRESKDHGILGGRSIVLGKENLLPSLTQDEFRLVRAAVVIHNRKKVPEGISSRLRQIVDVVRDADKLDIYRVMVAHFTRAPGDFPVVTLHAKDNPDAYTRGVFDDALNGVQGDYKKIVYVNDFKLLLCGWVNDFNFMVSRRIAHKRGLVQDLLNTLPDYPEMRELGGVVYKRLIQDL